MACDALTLPGAVHGVIAEPVTGLPASRTRAIGGEDVVAEAVAHCCHKFWRLQQQSQAWGGKCRQPVPCVRVGDAE